VAIPSSPNVTVVREAATKLGMIFFLFLCRPRGHRETWAIGFGLNARAATGIILAGVGLTNGVIDARIFVAIVVMALVTSLMAGPAMSRLLWRHQAMAGRRVTAAMQRS
jgi:Kef-type K+ transport system membrane component KefB